MDDLRTLPDWAVRVRELTAEINANCGDSKVKAEAKRELVREAERAGHSPAEIARLIGVTQARVGQLLGRTRAARRTDSR